MQEDFANVVPTPFQPASPNGYQVPRRPSLLAVIGHNEREEERRQSLVGGTDEAVNEPFGAELQATRRALAGHVEAELAALARRLRGALENELAGARQEGQFAAIGLPPKPRSPDFSAKPSRRASLSSRRSSRLSKEEAVVPTEVEPPAAVESLGDDLSELDLDVPHPPALGGAPAVNISAPPRRGSTSAQEPPKELAGSPSSGDNDRRPSEDSSGFSNDSSSEDHSEAGSNGFGGDHSKTVTFEALKRRDSSTNHLAFEVLDCWRKNHKQLAAKLGSRNFRQATEDTLGIHMMAVNDEESESIDEEEFEGSVVRKEEGPYSKLLLHPNCVKRGIWEIASLVLVVYDTIWIPLQLLEPEDSTFSVMMEWITRLYWTFDIGASCITGFVTADGFIELRPRRILMRYVSTWFPLDLIVVGIDWMEIFWSAAQGGGYARIGRATRAFRIIRMIRLLRVVRIKELVKIFFESVRSETIKEMSDMIKIVLLILGTGHLFACFWYGLGSSGIEPGSWVQETFGHRHSLGYRYVTSLHWSLSQYSGGMDEVRPVNVVERVYAIVIFVFTLMVGAVLVSSLTSSMTQLNILANEKKTKMTMLRKYLMDNRITNRLTLRVQRNAQHALVEQEHYIPEAHVELLQLVSEPLRIELHFELYARILKHHPFFEEYIDACPHIMQKVCHCAPSMMGVSHGDIIFNVGEIPPKPKMIIVTSGTLQYLNTGKAAPATIRAPDGKRASRRVSHIHTEKFRRSAVLPSTVRGAAILHPGDWISEPVLWTHWMHRGILTASSDSRMCLLDACKFQDQVSSFDHDEFNPKVYAAGFVEALNNTEDISDCIPDLEVKALSKLERHMQSLAQAKQQAFRARRGNVNAGVGRAWE